MKNWSKIAMTAGAIGALGVAGSFGTFAAFTDSDSASYDIGAGTVDVAGGLELPNVTQLGTREAKKAGKVTFTNNGTEPVSVNMDASGTPNTLPGTLLGENIEVDSYLDAGYTQQLDDRTRLQVINARPAAAIPTWDSVLTSGGDVTKFQPKVIGPGESVSLYFKVRLRQRSEGGDNGDDNAMQGLQATETITGTAIEAAN